MPSGSFYYGTPEIPDDPMECAVSLRNNILALTTQGGSELEYRLVRTRLLNDPAIKKHLPDFVRYSTDAATLRSTLSEVASGGGSWELRRNHVKTAFEPLFAFLEKGGDAVGAVVSEGLTQYDAPAVQAIWAKALERRLTDPGGAVTAAGTLLEEVCKHIIEDSGGKWGQKWTTPTLYSEVAKVLRLSPDQHQGQAFKVILGNCQSVVQGISALRNKGGDAHGGGRSRVAYKSRHAALAVNLAGSMALFLIETWNARVQETNGSIRKP